MVSRKSLNRQSTRRRDDEDIFIDEGKVKYNERMGRVPFEEMSEGERSMWREEAEELRFKRRFKIWD